MRSRAEREGVDTDEAVRRMAAEARIARVGEPEDVAALVAFVASAEGGCCTGRPSTSTAG